MTAKERAHLIHTWKIAMVHNDIGEAAQIRRLIEKEPAPVASAEPSTEPSTEPQAAAQAAPQAAPQAVSEKAPEPPKKKKVVAVAMPERETGSVTWPQGEFTVKGLVEAGWKQPETGQRVARALELGQLKVVRTESHGRGRPARILSLA